MMMMMGLCNLLTYKDLHLSEQIVADYEMVGHANAMWLSNEAQAAKHVKGESETSRTLLCATPMILRAGITNNKPTFIS